MHKRSNKGSLTVAARITGAADPGASQWLPAARSALIAALWFSSVLVTLVLGAAGLLAAELEVCDSVPVYEPCEISFEMTAEEAAQHPNPYLTVNLRAEFRSPKAGKTTIMSGFWDGGRTFRLRFSPRDLGEWAFRVRSNLASFDGKIATFQATEPRTPGFLHVFNLRYFRYDERGKPHFWMGDSCYPLFTISYDSFQQLVDLRAAQRFNHMRAWILGDSVNAHQVLSNPDQPATSYFREVDRRIRYLNQKGMFLDLIFASDVRQWLELLPKPEQRDRFVRYLVARYASRNITWQGLGDYERHPEGRDALKEIYGYIGKYDFYGHPRSTATALTSGPLFSDEWMDYVAHRSSSPNLASVEYEVYAAPHVNTEVGLEDPNASATTGRNVDHDQMRRRLWNAAVHGQYVTYGHAGTYGGDGNAVDVRFANAPGARYATHLYDFFAQTRYWDLQPHYRVEGAAALSLEILPYLAEIPRGIEYVAYLHDSQPIELRVQDEKYDVSWFNPADGTWIHEKEKFKGERFTGSPPDPSRDWVLYVRREGRKLSMNNKFILESRKAKAKEVQTATADLPYEIQLPSDFELQAGTAVNFNATLKKNTRSAKKMRWLWTAEVASSSTGPRVLGAEQFGEWLIPEDLTTSYPAPLQVRLLGVDGAGRVFEAFKPYKLVKPE